jgi:hypothetical protein
MTAGIEIAFIIVTVLAVVLLAALAWDIWDYFKDKDDK